MYFLAIHSVVGITWGEWAAIAAIIAALWAAGAKVAKIIAQWSHEVIEEVVDRVTDPVIVSVNELRNMTEVAQHRTDRRLSDHDDKLGAHSREIGELYGTVGLVRRGRNNDRNEN